VEKMKNTLTILIVALVFLTITSCSKTYCTDCVAFDPVNDSIVNNQSTCDKNEGFVDGYIQGFKRASDSLGWISHCTKWVDD
jgi:hypothetical protein